MRYLPKLPNIQQTAQFVFLIVCGGSCGGIAWSLSLPLPFMLGGLFSTMLIVSYANKHGQNLYFPRVLRMLFIGLIGAMIGSTFSPDVLEVLPDIALTLCALTLYVAVAHVIGYQICRHVGKYDPVTAFYSSMPGGFVEAVILGEKGGGNVQVLTLSHFLRLCVVVVSVPTFFYFYLGDTVGSSAGQTFETRPWQWMDVLQLSTMAIVGLVVGRALHIPAGHLLGPMLLSAGFYGFGFVTASSPSWLLLMAQLFTGVGLGVQLLGANNMTFRQILVCSVLMIAVYLALCLVAVLAITQVSGLDFNALLLSFAPGGVTEMGLIALSLSLSPVIVSAHHVYRIFLTVFVAALSTRWFQHKHR